MHTDMRIRPLEPYRQSSDRPRPRLDGCHYMPRPADTCVSVSRYL